MKLIKKCRAKDCKKPCKGAEVFCSPECWMKNKKEKAEEYRKLNQE